MKPVSRRSVLTGLSLGSVFGLLGFKTTRPSGLYEQRDDGTFRKLGDVTSVSGDSVTLEDGKTYKLDSTRREE